MRKTGCMMQLLREKQSKELKNRKRWLGKCPLRTQLVFTAMRKVESAVNARPWGETQKQSVAVSTADFAD
jgi:hypothetical protein